MSFTLKLVQVAVAAVFRIRWFAFGVRVSSVGPTGVNQVFMHPKNTTLSFLCQRVDGRGKRTECGTQVVRGMGAGGTNFRE